jgi:hypothetical protein
MLALHSKVVGDIAASQKKIQKKNLSIVMGTMPLQKIVDTSICVPFDYNRDTKVEWATNCLDKEGGFNWQLFGSIEGIENPITGAIEIWDGLGRLCLAQLANVQKIPVIVHKHGSPGALFVKKQKLRNRTLNQEAHFVSYVSVIEQGGTVDDKTDKEIVNEINVLNTCGLRVESGINNYAPKTSQVATSPRIAINAVRRALKITKGNVAELKAARNMIFNAYSSTDFIGKELFEGCVYLFAASPNALKNGTYKSLCDFLKSMNNISQKDLPFKHLGGNQHNDEARSVAIGIWEMWSKSSFAQGHPSTVLRRKHIEDFDR